MNLPEGFRVKPKPSSTSRNTTVRAPTFFNSFAAAKDLEKGKEKERDVSSSKKPQPPVEFKRRPPPAYILDPVLKRSLANDRQRAASKLSNSQAAGKSVLRPPSFALTSAAAQSKAAAKSQSSSNVVYRTLPIPFYNAAAGPSTFKAPAPPSQKPSSSSQGWKPRGIPKFILPSTKPAIDPEKLKNMVTPSTTKFALATNPMTEAGARGLAAIMAAHKAKNAELLLSSWDRGMMMSPEKRDAKGRWKFVRGGLAARVSDYYKSSATATSLWQHEMDYNIQKKYPTGAHHMEVRIVKIVKRPFRTRYEREARSAVSPTRRRGPRFKRTTPRKPKPKPKSTPTHLKTKATVIALCEVISSHYRTRELIRIVFVYPENAAKAMFKPRDAPWKEGAVVRVWRPWSGFSASPGSEERSPFMPRARKTKSKAKSFQAPWKMDIDKPKSNKRRRTTEDEGMDIDIIMLGKPPHKRPRLSGDPKRKSKPLPLPSNTPMSVDELKKLPVGETVLVVKRFMVAALKSRSS